MMVQKDKQGVIRPPRKVPGGIDVFKPAVDVLGVRNTETVTKTESTNETVRGSEQLNAEISPVGLYVVDEIESPVAEKDRALAWERLRWCVSSNEVMDAENAGGISRLESAKIYQQILGWLKENNIPDLELDDPSFDTTVYTPLEGLTRMYFSRDDVDTNHKMTNLLSRFIHDNSIDVKRGELEKNLFAIIAMYDMVKDVTLT